MNKKKKDFIILIVIMLITFTIFIPFLRPHFATDSYYVANKGYTNYVINNSLKDGRVFMGLIGCIAEIFNIPIDTYIVTLTILALVISCITIIVLKNLILSYKKTDKLIVEIFVISISYFTIFNFMYIENLFFIECLVMALSILFYLLAAKILVNKNKLYIKKAVILVICGILCYQGTMSMYLISVLVFSLMKNKEYKQVIKDMMLSGCILILGVLIQLLTINCIEKIFGVHQVRISSIKNLIPNVIITFKEINRIILSTGCVYTKYLYITLILLIEILILVKAYKDKLSNNILINQLLIIGFSILFGLAVSFISTSGFLSARIRYSIGTTIGFLLVYLYTKTDLTENIKLINTLIITVFCIYALSIIFNYVSIMINSLKVNYRDKENALEIISYIENYEKENNINVKNIALFYGTFNNKIFYKDLKYNGSVLSWSSMRTQWSIEGTLEMYSDRDFNLIEPNENELEYYKNNADKNKDYLCIGDTLYMSYYLD